MKLKKEEMKSCLDISSNGNSSRFPQLRSKGKFFRITLPVVSILPFISRDKIKHP